jgi:hypothetical protein
MKKLLKRRLIIALLVIICISGFSGCKAFIRWWGGVEKEAIVHSGRSQVGNYEWFFDQYHACKAQAAKVKFIDAQYEASQIKMVLAGMVEEYNSRSRQSWTRATWKSDELPYQIDLEELLK